jgi:hypothetical protein
LHERPVGVRHLSAQRLGFLGLVKPRLAEEEDRDAGADE